MPDQPAWGSDEWRAQNVTGPVGDEARARLAMDPESRRAEDERRKAEANARQAADFAEMQREATKTEETRLKVAEKELEKEKVKRRKEDAPRQADPSTIELEFAMASDTNTVSLEYLLHPFLPARCVVGFYGRGSSAKSSFVASMAAHISGSASTLWISVEELADWIKVRHTKTGGRDRTLQVVKAVAVKQDHQGRTVGSTFNVYEHLEPAIIAAALRIQNLPAEYKVPPLRLVVLDTAIGLTTWAASAGPSSDEGVKKLIAFLQGLAETHNVTIAVIGHLNKSQKHEHFADAVSGSTAWTNSPRLSFMHAANPREDYAYVMRVAKTNLAWFGMPYTTAPVHVLYKAQEEGVPDSVLVKVEPGPIVWGKQEAGDLWDEITTIPKDDEEGFVDRRKPTVVDIVRDKLVELTHASPDQIVNREQVQAKLPGVRVNRAQWRKVDDALRQFQFMYRVEMTTGSQNMVLYRALPVEVPK